MSIIDTLSAFSWLTSNLWIPKSYEIYPATLGNDISCNIQGFVAQMAGSASVLYNLFLSIYYLLVIKYRWSDRKLRRFEKICHIVPWSFGLITAIIPAVMGLYNPASWVCWISTDYRLGPNDRSTATVNVFQMFFFYVPVWITIIVSIICMFMIYSHVRKTESKTSGASLASAHLARTKQVAQQGRFFVAALIVTWFFASTTRSISMAQKEAPSDVLIILSGTLAPSQGFFNALAYYRIRAERQKRENPDMSWWRIAAGIVQVQLIPCWKARGAIQDDGNDCEARLDDDKSGKFQSQRRFGKKRSTTAILVAPNLADYDWRSLRLTGVNTIGMKSAREEVTLASGPLVSHQEPTLASGPLGVSHQEPTK